jgi:hypothetical protein
MYQNVSLFSIVFYKLESRIEGVTNFLSIAVVQIKFNMADMLGVFEAEIYSGAHRFDTIFL